MAEIKKRVLLNTIPLINQFTTVVNQHLLGKVDVHSINNRHRVDGGSIMGLFSLDLSNTVYAVLLADDEETVALFHSLMEQFSVD